MVILIALDATNYKNQQIVLMLAGLGATNYNIHENYMDSYSPGNHKAINNTRGRR